MKSLYMNPQKKENQPMSNNKYLVPYIGFKASYLCPNRHRKMEKARRRPPWPISPNMTPKRKGKLMMVNMVGFTSLYFGTPYVSMITWNCSVKEFILKYVGVSKS